MITYFRALAGAAADFMHHGCLTLAASIAFFTLLSLLPMVFLVLNVVGLFISQDRIGHEYLLHFMEGFLPNIWPELAEEIVRVASERAVRWVVLATFGWFGLLMFYEVEYATHIVFQTSGRRNPILATLRSIALLGLVGILLILSFLATEFMSIIVSLAPRLVALDPSLAGLEVLVGTANQLLLSYLLPFVLLIMSATLLYRYLPKQRPAWRHALIGGVFMALLWEVTKHLFTSYVNILPIYGRMYGSLITTVLFLLWIYYTATLFLFGATLVNRLQILADRRSSLAEDDEFAPDQDLDTFSPATPDLTQDLEPAPIAAVRMTRPLSLSASSPDVDQPRRQPSDHLSS